MKDTNNKTSIDHNMLVNENQARVGKKILALALKETMEELHFPQRHLQTSRNLATSNKTTMEVKTSHKGNIGIWTPSQDLMKYNKKQLILHREGYRLKKEIIGCNSNQSSIINMIGMSYEDMQTPKKSEYTGGRMKHLIYYKNGPKFRKEKLPESICKIDMIKRTNTPEVKIARRMQHSMYKLIRSNSRSSKIFQ